MKTDIKQKVKASSIEERIANLEETKRYIEVVEAEMNNWYERAKEAEEGGSWWKECWKNYNSKLWLKQRLEEIAEEA